MNNVGARDFSKHVINKLAAKGIQIVGITAIPDFNGGFIDSTRGYKINDNGTGKIWNYGQVLNEA